jgi:hypothetical protein
MSRAGLSSPVSYAQGMGNRETATNALTDRDLQVPKRIGQKPASGKLKSGCYHVADSTKVGSCSDAPLLKIVRIYQHQTAVLDDLVDVLDLLLVDGSEARLSSSLTATATPCFPSAPE